MPTPPEDRCGATGKVRHRHRKSAAAACRQHTKAARAKGRRDPVLNVYRCAFCAGWHCGNQDDLAARAGKARRPKPEPTPDED